LGRRAAFIRLNSDGSFDPTFQLYSPFNEIIRVRYMIPLDDGKILVASDPFSDLGLNRFNPDGSIDPTFNRPLIYDSALPDWHTWGVFTMNLLSDGRILVGGLFDTVANSLD